MTDHSRSSFDDLHAAFDRLDTQQKTAFVFQATFDTIGQAVRETGGHIARTIESLDFEKEFTWPKSRHGRKPGHGSAADPAAPPPAPPEAPGSL